MTEKYPEPKNNLNSSESNVFELMDDRNNELIITKLPNGGYTIRLVADYTGVRLFEKAFSSLGELTMYLDNRRFDLENKLDNAAIDKDMQPLKDYYARTTAPEYTPPLFQYSSDLPFPPDTDSKTND